MSACHNILTDCQGGGNGGDVGDDDGTLACGLMEVALTGVGGYIAEDATEGLALEVGAVGIAHEIEVHPSLFEDDFLDAELFATDTQGNHTNQFFGHLRDLAKAVCQTLTIGSQGILQVVTASEVVEFAVEQHTLGVAGDVEVGEVHLEV